ncbi:hypothetical protein TNCV_4995521 [Trichonephila clavipes]|nr:hypothetical protein TNCV_4995521 [Trichonephila clavipes]
MTITSAGAEEKTIEIFNLSPPLFSRHISCALFRKHNPNYITLFEGMRKEKQPERAREEVSHRFIELVGKKPFWETICASCPSRNNDDFSFAMAPISPKFQNSTPNSDPADPLADHRQQKPC